MKKIWMNGRLVDARNAKISVFDRGFLYGDGIFETMRSYAGVIFQLDEHLARFFRSMRLIGVRSPYDSSRLKDALYKSLKMNGLKSAYIRMTMTRGEGAGLVPKTVSRPNIIIVAKELEECPAWMYEQGISARCVDITTQNENSPVSGIKSLSFLNYILAKLDAVHSGFDEAILVNTKGCIAEGASSNIFFVKNEVLITPSARSGILSGITRDVVIRIAKKLNIRTIEKEVTYKELINSNEIFLTNSLSEILPLTRLDAKRIGRGSPGEVTKLLRISYQKEVIRKVIGSII